MATMSPLTKFSPRACGGRSPDRLGIEEVRAYI
jgi:hypothetical protein